MLPSLTDVCIETIARHMPLAHTAALPLALADPALAERLLLRYRQLHAARSAASTTATPQAAQQLQQQHVAALRQFAALWQPAVLCLRAPSGDCLAELQAHFADCLQHLELSASVTWLSGLGPGLARLTCLSLRGCTSLAPASLQTMLAALPQLLALDLCGLAAATDALAPTLLGMQQLQVLQLNRTACGDLTVEWLTYGSRCQQHWQQQQQPQWQQPGSCHQQQQAPDHHHQQPANTWPRTQIHSWHLAYSRATPRAAELLTDARLVRLSFLDLRGSGVRASQLTALRARHALTAPQGAVLSRSAALALAAGMHEGFVCADPGAHSAAAAAATAAGGGGGGGMQLAGCSGAAGQQLVNTGVQELLQAVAGCA